uniref:Uncharacterized protein n=1 Tax=Corethron hystrix TaxID=216773 RepID=A0A7S1BPG4_9STRA|mmetsp:Transcript_36296/g.84913  ORF Transcript_36296/g.84913 Transcript_36296/m.84913 type:complete len:105 (+) Transcript_36296:314-628(+)|eukprot:CAMPEP_0113302002 /NCGR_PEP_ID=MMETSP0010_2-20120614/2993_1 /TAXON_ID=216773 ORGANISM="Corethron hystrix, Strain 308" /NCGR_SAMPLE_ID=MMETSP0010_2 /ASSEMBLY_ACC=CAM_ASM_000155 /LENGTH=104 /DNA_ID=CAMNT_0000155713 /DNA_START=89 /DNA_END=403 /DNA_ORIENTATION=+ /assembly_acc=CAM_ASM_000155
MKFRQKAPTCETALYDMDNELFKYAESMAFPASPRASEMATKKQPRSVVAARRDDDQSVLSNDVTEIAANGRMKNLPRSSRPTNQRNSQKDSRHRSSRGKGYEI